MNKDCIQLTVPAKPEYIMVTRLTASSVASRLGFDVDTIEDIKFAVAEAAILIMDQKRSFNQLILYFYLMENELSIEIQGSELGDYRESQTESDMEQREMSMFILNSMMDNVKLYSEDGHLYKITMIKNYRS